MGDTWQYRVRVSGKDRLKWKKKATNDEFGREHPHYSWPMLGKFRDGRTYPAGGTWYNVTLRETEEYVELLGNFSGHPASYFEKKSEFTDEFRHGPALFGALNIEVEIVGQSWEADSPSGVYSYRDVFSRGKLVSSVKSEDASIALEYASDLVAEFPDPHTPEERARWEREATQEREEEARRKEKEAAQKRLTWNALRPGALVEISKHREDWMSVAEKAIYVVEHVEGDVGVFRYRLIGEDFDGPTTRLGFEEAFSIERLRPYCEHGEDRRTREVCKECEGLRRLVERDIKYMLDGLHARVVL